MEVNQRILSELEAMGFAKAVAAKALASSGNSSIEDAINWIVDHENETSASETPMRETEALVNINVEASSHIHISERVKLRAQELRNRVRRRKAEEEQKLEREREKVLNTVRRRKAEEEQKLEREREKERIRAGKELLEAKRMAEESERMRFIAQRKAEKEEERRARERVNQKLQQDKLERRGMSGAPREVPVPVKHDTVSPQITKIPQPVDPDGLPVRHTSASERMRECLRSLKLQNKDDNTISIRAFQTLLVYVKNILTNPDEVKFRKIRISNPIFQDKVGRFDEGIKFLEICGFERVEGGNFLVLPKKKVDMRILKSAAVELHNALTNPYFGLFSR